MIGAAASSGLPVSIASTTPAVCTISGNWSRWCARDLFDHCQPVGQCRLQRGRVGDAELRCNRAGHPVGPLIAGPGQPVCGGNGPDFVAVGDFNGDGIPDLAMANVRQQT